MSHPVSANCATANSSSILNAAVGLTSLGVPSNGPRCKSSGDEFTAKLDIAAARVSSQGKDQGVGKNKIHEPALTTTYPQRSVFRLPVPLPRSIPSARYAVSSRATSFCKSLAHLSQIARDLGFGYPPAGPSKNVEKTGFQSCSALGAGFIPQPFPRDHLMDAGRYRLGTTDRDAVMGLAGGLARPTAHHNVPNCLLQADSALDLPTHHLPPLPTPHQISYVPNAKTFPETLFDIVSSGEYAHIISWLPHGRGFIILDKSRFASDILPRFFDGAKFTSFTRRLKRWSFVRVPRGAELGAYYNPNFVRDRPKMVQEMKYRNDTQFEEAKKKGEGNEKTGGVEDDEEAIKSKEEEEAGEIQDNCSKAEETHDEVSSRPKKQKEDKPHAQSSQPSPDTIASPERNSSDVQGRQSKIGPSSSPKGSHPIRIQGSSVAASKANKSRAPSELTENRLALAYGLPPEVHPNLAPSKLIEDRRLLDATRQELWDLPRFTDELTGGLAPNLLGSQRMLDAKQASLVLERELLLRELAKPYNIIDFRLNSATQCSQRNDRFGSTSISSAQSEHAGMSPPESLDSNKTRYRSGCSGGDRPVMMSQEEEREFAEYLLSKRKAMTSRQTDMMASSSMLSNPPFLSEQRGG